MPNVYSDTLTHDAVLVWLAPPTRDVIGGVGMRTAPPPAVGDDVPMTEAVTVQVGLALAVADDTPGSEVIAIGLPLLPRVVDTTGPGEAVEGRLSVLLPAVHDDRAPGEGVTAAMPVEVVAADLVGPVDSVAVRNGLVVVDSLTPDDQAAVTLPLAPAVADPVPPAEGITLHLNVLTIAVADSVVVGDVVNPLSSVVIQVADALAITERRFVTAKKAKKVKIRPQSQGQGGG